MKRIRDHTTATFLNNNDIVMETQSLPCKRSRRPPALLTVLGVASLLVRRSDGFAMFPRGEIPLLSSRNTRTATSVARSGFELYGWVQDGNGEWEWEEENIRPGFTESPKTRTAAAADATPTATLVKDRATPQLPTGAFKPKQSLGQNFLQDGNTVGKIVRTFARDATETVAQRDWERPGVRPVELGPGPGALTGSLVEIFGEDKLRCVEIDGRAVALLEEAFPKLRVSFEDVLQSDYPAMAQEEGGPLSVIGNLPYYITSQILFALADASHVGAVRSATVTMQWEVAQRIVSKTRTKDYGILSVVFQLYADCKVHFKIPPTVFYPQPKVDSALVGIRFVGPDVLRQRLAGVDPRHLRRVLAAVYQQRRKTVRNGLKKLAAEVHGSAEQAKEILDGPPCKLPPGVLKRQQEGDAFALSQSLPDDWARLRPEELSPGQTVELTRLVFGPYHHDDAVPPSSFGTKVWRKFRHGSND